jgi:polysaccharide biosynthesis/export protein
MRLLTKGLSYILVALTVSTLFSCGSAKNAAYFQSPDPNADSVSNIVAPEFIALIQPGDIISILVSSTSVEASSTFNPYLIMQAAASPTPPQYNTPAAAIGYLVDAQGFVTVPYIGKIKLSGMSTVTASDTITKKLGNYLVEPTVGVRILNFKVSVMGEVVKPSVYTIPNEKVTLPEALALAGDLTIFGKRSNILVIREVEGRKVYSRIDLTKRDLFNSPYYYLHPNDIIYVEPVKGRFTASDRAIQLTPIIISALALLTTLIIAIK